MPVEITIDADEYRYYRDSAQQLRDAKVQLEKTTELYEGAMHEVARLKIAQGTLIDRITQQLDLVRSGDQDASSACALIRAMIQ